MMANKPRKRALVFAGVAILVVSLWWLTRHRSSTVQLRGRVSPIPRVSDDITLEPRVRVLALYFPQFHSDPLNDHLWGDGFTDWNNLRRYPQNRDGQPMNAPLSGPNDLGQYDLTSSWVREKHGELARQYGVDGFIYHHYWFYNECFPAATLAAPLEEMLADGHPDVPFALHWANQNWTRTWLGMGGKQSGKTKEVLVHQRYPALHNGTNSAIRAHYVWLRRFLRHDNYIKTTNGSPVIFHYRAEPGCHHILKLISQWHAKEFGVPVTWIGGGKAYSRNIGAKRVQELHHIAPIFGAGVAYPGAGAPLKFLNMPQKRTDILAGHLGRRRPYHVGLATDYDDTPRRTLEKGKFAQTRNLTAASIVVKHNLACCIAYQTLALREKEESEDLYVVVNAWNEWAENMVLEPSQRHGYRMLEAIREAKADVQKKIRSVRDWPLLSQQYVKEFASSTSVDSVDTFITKEANAFYQVQGEK